MKNHEEGTKGAPSPQTIGSERRFSIAAGLHYRFVGKLLVLLLVLDLLVCILFGAGLLYRAETVGSAVFQKIEAGEVPQENVDTWTSVAGLSIAASAELPEGVMLPKLFRGIVPFAAAQAVRTMEMEDENTDSFWQTVRSIRYIYAFTWEDTSYRVSFDWGKTLSDAFSAGLVILAVELFVLLHSVLFGANQIRRRLRPIVELAEAAQTLNAAGLSGTGGVVDVRAMENLADKLDGINATKLDTKISVDAKQEELKDLADAINDMLARINDSYRSQIRFVSDASHELRTPISVIQGYANLLERWGKDDEKTLNESIRAIKDEAANMKGLVEQLLFLARGDTNTMTLQLEEFDLAEVAEEVIRESELTECAHQYEAQLKPTFVYADRALLKQLLRILNDNAMKYSNQDGKIKISVTSDDGFARLSVQDEGIGIPAHSVPLIFDRFYRADQSRARATGGTGLGLSIAKWITERHGGHMEVLSREDFGTRISVLVPMATSTITPPSS